MAHQVVVIGMGRFGASVARELYRIGHDVLIVDQDAVLAQQMMGQVTYAVSGDATSAELLEELGIEHFDTAVVAIGTDIQSSVLTTVLLKQQFNVPEVVARATNELHGRTLTAVGADRVVYPEQETGVRTAHSLFQHATLGYMELTSDYGFSKINATPEMVGKTLEACGFAGASDGVKTSVVAIRRGREPILSPPKDEAIQEGDILVVAGRESALEQLRPQGVG
jgi:trk system potassium uptake protein TrkA